MSTPSGLIHKPVLASRRLVPIMASNSEVPSQIQLIKAGSWPASSAKGPLEITIADLHEFKRNFDAGVGLPGDGEIGLPIDFSHNSWEEAAGWIKSLDVVGDVLMASVEWTDAGKQALEGGQFKCISPSFWPMSMGDWTDPEDPNITAHNVLDGAGLTNIPFFKDLTPIMASNTSGEGGKNRNVIYINADERNNMPNLDEVRVKDAASLTDEEKQLLETNKADLSADERAKFGIAEDAAPVATPPAEAAPVADPEAAAITASLKSGELIAVKASTFNTMQEQIASLNRDKITASVKTHVARGAIKADQIDNWVKRIEADATVEQLLTDLPANPVLASEVGASEQGDPAATAQDELMKGADDLMKEDSNLNRGDAVKKVLATNSDLAARVKAERADFNR